MLSSITFTEPRLCHYNYDLSKSWFVYFDITDTLMGKTVRKQFRSGINRWRDKQTRLRDGNALKAMWKMKLANGTYNPFAKPGQIFITDAPKTLKNAIETILAIKQASLKKKSGAKYREVAKVFFTWLDQNRCTYIKLYQFSGQMAQGYLDHLLINKKYSGKSHNNHMHILKALFNAAKRRWSDYMGTNPFVGIESLPEDIGNNLAYNESERSRIIEFLKTSDKRMYYAVAFLFHGFIRKTELSTLRVGDIDFDNRTIKINSAASKNRMQDSITITDGLLPVLYEMGLDLAPKHFFIFGAGMATVEKQISKADIISDKYLLLKKKLGFKANDGKTFYAWKHTGVVCYWKVVKDIYFMMRQLRHHDMKTTMIYLKSLGLMPNEAFINAKVIL